MKHFTRKGDSLLFSCPCGCGLKPTSLLLSLLDATRTRAKVSMRVTSGPRCAAYCESRGWSTTSEHTLGTAADIYCRGSMKRKSIIQAALEAGFTRIGIGKDFIHLGYSETHTQNIIWLY